MLAKLRKARYLLDSMNLRDQYRHETQAYSARRRAEETEVTTDQLVPVRPEWAVELAHELSERNLASAAFLGLYRSKPYNEVDQQLYFKKRETPTRGWVLSSNAMSDAWADMRGFISGGDKPNPGFGIALSDQGEIWRRWYQLSEEDPHLKIDTPSRIFLLSQSTRKRNAIGVDEKSIYNTAMHEHYKTRDQECRRLAIAALMTVDSHPGVYAHTGHIWLDRRIEEEVNKPERNSPWDDPGYLKSLRR